ncbi:MAG: acyl-CoA thioesterase [Candidatus Cloacimonadaceae bacterium]|mgnify:CR=1 FL=1|nr:acyl-CoA thioesterase [Candidatus Cloacimonadota bacterium]MDY0319692.1 acyl-CoA thioesterase [Candidatus Cloacimonadaceae bacterium]HQB97498.1 acyl-CoA thioesterase [Candidatus Cloacimonadota bacterium]
MIFTFQKKIYGYECDIYGHMNNANYLMLLEAARSEALVTMEMPIGKLQEMGVQFFVLRCELDYIKAAELEEIVTVKSWFYKTSRLKGFWQQEVYNQNGELCLRAMLTLVYAADGKAKRLSQELTDHFDQFLERQ